MNEFLLDTLKKKIVIIGKGITFDAGGLNLKPASSMLTMKDDMSGAAAVLSIMRNITESVPNVRRITDNPEQNRIALMWMGIFLRSLR